MGYDDIAAHQRLDSAISRLIILSPIYGLVFPTLKKIEDTNLPTMAVGTISRVNLALYYNPNFVKSLTATELTAVLIHESLHILLHHISRSHHYNFNPKGFNIAADLAINSSIVGLPKFALFPKSFGLPENEAAEWYYRKLQDEAKKQGKQAGDMSEGIGDLVDDHSKWGDCNDEIIKEKIKGIARKAISEQEKKGWGNIPGNLVQQIIAANRSIVNWKKEVRYFINKMVLHGHHATRTRLNRREQASIDNRVGDLKNVYLQPGKRKDYTSRLLVALDTSGSVSDKELRSFVDELNGMINHIQCDYVCFDTQLYLPVNKFSKKAREVKVKGRGGTSFHPICEYIDDHNYDGLIIMTDGFAPFPTKPRAKTLWCLTKSGAGVNPPFGKKVVIEEKTS